MTCAQKYYGAQNGYVSTSACGTGHGHTWDTIAYFKPQHVKLCKTGHSSKQTNQRSSKQPQHDHSLSSAHGCVRCVSREKRHDKPTSESSHKGGIDLHRGRHMFLGKHPLVVAGGLGCFVRSAFCISPYKILLRGLQVRYGLVTHTYTHIGGLRAGRMNEEEAAEETAICARPAPNLSNHNNNNNKTKQQQPQQQHRLRMKEVVRCSSP
jgi:hypothetical protein